jgi:hypothetical protein
VTTPAFGDKVRIANTDDAEGQPYAGEVGQVLGESMPSASGVGPVIGDRGDDRALGVQLERTGEVVWFAPHLVEFVDHQSGATMSLDGGPTFVRMPDGTWHEVGAPTEAGAMLNPGRRIPHQLPGGLAALMRWLTGRSR